MCSSVFFFFVFCRGRNWNIREEIICRLCVWLFDSLYVYVYRSRQGIVYANANDQSFEILMAANYQWNVDAILNAFVMHVITWFIMHRRVNISCDRNTMTILKMTGRIEYYFSYREHWSFMHLGEIWRCENIS